MAEQDGKRPLPRRPVEDESLSGQMRDLILSQRVEDRRKKPDDGDDAGLTQDTRRREDHTHKQPNNES